MTPRRQALIECFEAARPRWLSLDVFDTLLWRGLDKPVDVFPEIHRRLVEAEHKLPMSAGAFAAARIAAEQAARRRQASAEICIDEVCSELSAALGGRPEAPALAEAELAAERACLQLDDDIAALVLHAAERGVPYILVSDMYLRARHLADLVSVAAARSGIVLPAPAHIFASGERRANKAGELFDQVLGTLACAPGEVLHVGDNPVADIQAPARRGIRAFHYARESSYAARVFDLERKYLAQPARPKELGLRAARAKAVMSGQCNADTPTRHFHYGALILGPLFASFAEWVVADCEARRQRRVHCLMREGHLVAPLLRQAARALGVELDVRTLWSSRYALRGASFRQASEAELRGYFRKRHRVNLGTAARDLGVDEGTLRRSSAIKHEDGLDDGEVGRVIEALRLTPSLRLQLLASAASKRRRLMRYFEQAGVLEDEVLTLVDLGWAGSQQHYLARLLAEVPAPRHLRGLYFATHAGLLELPLANCSTASFLFHLGAPAATYACLQRTPEILENACMPQTGSFMGIDEHERVRNFPQLLPAAQLTDMAELQRGIARFARLWFVGASERRALMSHADWQLRLDRLRALLARSLEQPLAEEVALFQDWQHDSNDGSAMVEPLLGSEATRRRARAMPYRRIRDLSWIDCYWPQGLASLLGKTAGGSRWRLIRGGRGNG